jgi:non-ribosomal peptide synthetase component F
LDYWKGQLGGLSAHLGLPTDRPRPAVKTYRGAREQVKCSGELLEKLKRLSDRQDVTLYMTLLAAFSVLLSRYCGKTDIAVGTPIANRNRPEVENLIGFFVNTLAMRIDASGDPSFTELLSRVRETALGAYSHQDVPFEAVVDALQLERSLSHSPLFQVMFVLQEAQDSRSAPLEELTLSPIAFDFPITKFDLTPTLQETSTVEGASIQHDLLMGERRALPSIITCGCWKALYGLRRGCPL